jgi:hypothetical protein
MLTTADGARFQRFLRDTEASTYCQEEAAATRERIAEAAWRQGWCRQRVPAN